MKMLINIRFVYTTVILAGIERDLRTVLVDIVIMCKALRMILNEKKRNLWILQWLEITY